MRRLAGLDEPMPGNHRRQREQEGQDGLPAGDPGDRLDVGHVELEDEQTG